MRPFARAARRLAPAFAAAGPQGVFRRGIFKLAIFTLAVGALAGCTLIDQRTFERAGHAPEAAAVANANLPPLPLLTIPFGNGGVDYQSTVQQAVDAVQGLKADADYDVVTLIPISAPEATQEVAAKNGQQDAAQVVSALGYAGVSLDHVHVGYRGDAGSPPREVLVFVR